MIIFDKRALDINKNKNFSILSDTHWIFFRYLCDLLMSSARYGSQSGKMKKGMQNVELLNRILLESRVVSEANVSLLLKLNASATTFCRLFSTATFWRPKWPRRLFRILFWLLTLMKDKKGYQ